MIVAGIGFRQGATLQALLEAYRSAGGGADALACPAHKTGASQIEEMAAHLGLPLDYVDASDLAHQVTLTRSPRQLDRFGTGSVAEAAALAAAGPDSRLLGPRVSSPCGTATAALARSSLPHSSLPHRSLQGPDT